MLQPKYAIIDIETTGANRGGNKITEIAIIVTDGKEILDSFSTLLNPERSIPVNITYLTGITNDMVMDKPKFYEVAKKIVEITDGCIFVAHNVFFDYNFIKSEFNELGFSYNRKKLCTVRMSRRAFPGLKSYSLGNLTKHFKISLKNHHRAMDDAKATFELFKLIQKNAPEITQTTLDEKSPVSTPPPKLETSKIDNLPQAPGLYYFYSEEGELLYVGKSKSIRSRVINHFRPNIKRKKDLQLKNQVADIQYVLTGNELAALLYESQEIKNLQPPFNTALKARKFLYFVHIKENSTGMPELKISTTQQQGDIAFKSKAQAKRAIENYLKKAFGAKDYEYLETTLINFHKVLGAETYRKKLEGFFELHLYPKDSFSVCLAGRKASEKCVISVIDSNLDGIYYLSNNEVVERIKIDENRDHRIILCQFIAKYKLKIRESLNF